MKTPVITAAQKQTWRKKLIPAFVLGSLFGQFSNQHAEGQTLPQAKSRPKMQAVVMKVTDDFSDGSYKATIPAIRVGATTVVTGPNVAKGRENRPTMNQVGAYYTVKRIPYALNDDSVEGDILKFYNWAEQTAGLITSDFVKQTDYDHQRATIEGAEEGLTNTAFWQDSEKGSSINAPLTETLHPNFYAWVGGKMVKNTWNTSYATALSNLETVLDDMQVSDTFNMKLLDAIHWYATRTVVPLGGFQGDRSIKYVLKISDVQWYQLFTDAVAGSLQDRFKYVETGFEKIYSGDMRIYRGILIVVDQRSPLAKIESNTVSFQYVTPQGDSRAPTATNASANSGTVEMAVLYGNGALIHGVKKELDFVQQGSDDYEFEKGLCGVSKNAVRRCDLDTAETPTSGRVNESSFIVATATANTGAGI